jgi:hypothetical protein
MKANTLALIGATITGGALAGAMGTKPVPATFPEHFGEHTRAAALVATL